MLYTEVANSSSAASVITSTSIHVPVASRESKPKRNLSFGEMEVQPSITGGEAFRSIKLSPNCDSGGSGYYQDDLSGLLRMK